MDNKERILEDLRNSDSIKRNQLRNEIIENSGSEDKDNILYILKFKGHGIEYIKIGITQLSVFERYKNGHGDFEYEILYEGYYSRAHARALEQLLLYEHREIGLEFEYPVELRGRFGGWTECVTSLNEDILDKYNIKLMDSSILSLN